MKIIVVGLGSMGKRRIRCLKALGVNKITGFDLREDRRAEVEKTYGIKTYTDIANAIKEENPDAFIISVPPDVHHIYMKLALEHRKHFFVEASVVDTDMDAIKKAVKEAGIVAAPSATMCFHPSIRRISEIVKSGELGKVSNIIYHSGQYLPDWHTYEAVSDYYVSNPATGGGREIVPFELTWITNLFGFPARVCGYCRKTVNIKGAESIDDTYSCLLDYGEFLATITVDVVSRYATRRLLINGDKKQLVWAWDENCIKLYNPESACWEQITYEMKDAAPGYNVNIGENMYIEEIRNFIEAIEGKREFINTMEDDHRILKLLYAIESADKNSKYIKVSI